MKTKSAKEAHKFLMEQSRENCLEFARLVEENGNLDLVVKSSSKAFEFLSETAVSQQLSNVDKQSVYQYKQKSSEDIQQKIITLLCAKINSKA